MPVQGLKPGLYVIQADADSEPFVVKVDEDEVVWLTGEGSRPLKEFVKTFPPNETSWTQIGKDPKPPPWDVTFRLHEYARDAFNEAIKRGVDDAVENVARELLRREMETGIRELIRAESIAILRETFAGKFQPHNQFGEPKGDPVTLRELIAGDLRRALEAKVALEDGNPVRPGEFRSTGTLLEHLIQRAHAEGLKKALQQVATEAGITLAKTGLPR